MTDYLLYAPDLEQVDADEAEIFAAIADTFRQTGEKVAEHEGRRLRASHAKATALLDGELTIDDGLPAELAQGLAAQPGRYPVKARFAQGPGELLDDRISTHRGLALKIGGLSGESIPEAAEAGTQDFVLEGSGRAFINSSAKTFLANLRAGVSHAPSLSQGVKQVVRDAARGTEAVLEAVGLESKTLAFFGHPPAHPLSEPYFSQVPMRWGDHVAKVGLFPTTATLEALGELEIDTDADPNAFRDVMIAHFTAHGATFELRVQLATDLDTTPIEDASVEWPQDVSPYRAVARLILPPQRAWTEDRETAFEALSFRPANSLTAHRPLGQVMRARLFVYRQLAEWRGARPTTLFSQPQPLVEQD